MKKLFLLIIPFLFIACGDKEEEEAPSASNVNELIYGHWKRSSLTETNFEYRDSVITYNFDENGFSYLCTVTVEDKFYHSEQVKNKKRQGTYSLNACSTSDISDCTHQLTLDFLDDEENETVDISLNDDKFVIYHRQDDSVWEENFDSEAL